MDKENVTHPISLLEIYFTKSIVVSIPEWPIGIDKEIEARPINNIEVTKIEGADGRYFTRMTSVLNAEKSADAPYYIDMECIAFFNADQKLPEEEARKGVHITAHSVLYGAIREAVLWLTGRQPFGPFTYGLSILRPRTKKEEVIEQK